MLMHAELLTFSISIFVAVVLLAPLLPPHGPRSEWGTSLHAVLSPCPVGSRARAQVALHCSPLQGFT